MMNTDIKNPRNAGRKPKEEKDKARSLSLSFPSLQADFVENNGSSKLIQRLVADEMKIVGRAAAKNLSERVDNFELSG